MADNQMFPKGLFVPLSGAEIEQPPAGAVVVKTGNQTLDIAPFLSVFPRMGGLLTQFTKNPYDARPLIQMRQLGATFVQAAQRVYPQQVQAALHPVVQAMASFANNSQKLVGMRLKTAHHLQRSPKILIPISLSIGAGGSTTGIQIRNPYLGATGGNIGQYTSPWTITAFRSGFGASGMLSPIRIPQFLLAGHDYVAAALGGITYTAGGAPATQGWSPEAFAEDARKIWVTTIQPWNVVALTGAGVGFGSIMSETGFLQLSCFNGGGGTYVATWSVYCNATLCGNVFGSGAYQQTDVFRQAYAPLAMQAGLAAKMANDAMVSVGNAIEGTQPTQGLAGFEYAERISRVEQQIRSFLDNPPNNIAMGDIVTDPSAYSLDPGASYEG